MMSGFSEFITKLSNVLGSFGFIDFLDICFVAFIIYEVIKILRETRAFQLIKGLLLFGVVYVIIHLLNMRASTFIFNNFITNIVVILAIVFQPEIRHTLETAGRSSISKLKHLSAQKKSDKTDVKNINIMIKEFAKACEDMSEKKIGSLTVFERATMLGEIIDTGTVIDSSSTQQLFCNVFYPKAPLHDGAAIVRGDRVYAAGCILPLTQKNNDVDKDLGTRHRAAIGMSEQSDAVVVVTSEETGVISIAYKGKLSRDFDKESLVKALQSYLIDIREDEEDTSIVSRIIGKFKGGEDK